MKGQDARSRALLRLLRHRVPPPIYELCKLVIIHIGLCELDAVEFFAGKKAVTMGLRRKGYRAASFEKEDDPASMDFLTLHGFILAVCMVLSLRCGGFLLAAPVCSAWGAHRKANNN